LRLKSKLGIALKGLAVPPNGRLTGLTAVGRFPVSTPVGRGPEESARNLGFSGQNYIFCAL